MKNQMKNQNSRLAFLLAFLCTLCTAPAQFFLKLGTTNIELSFQGIMQNTPLILGIIFYTIGSVLMIFALKFGDLSLVYPTISLAFIWVALTSSIFLKETISIVQWIGIIVIILGVMISGLSIKQGVGAKRGVKSD